METYPGPEHLEHRPIHRVFQNGDPRENKNLPTATSGREVTGLPLQQDHFDRPGVAQHALVLGSSGNVQSDPSVSAQPVQSGILTFQPDPAQEPVKPELTCLAPRATAIKEQGFSEAMAARIEAPQRGSTKWCFSNQVDFRAPPLKAIADFLLHLFQDRKLQPGTMVRNQPLLTNWAGGVYPPGTCPWPCFSAGPGFW